MACKAESRLSNFIFSKLSLAFTACLRQDISTFKESITLSEKVSLQGLFPIKRPIVKQDKQIKKLKKVNKALIGISVLEALGILILAI